MKANKTFHFSKQILMLLLVLLSITASAQPTDTTLLSIDRIFASPEFYGRGFGGAKWLMSKNGYTMLQPSKETAGGRDIALINLETGTKEILVKAALFVPKGETKPLSIESYEWSSDFNSLLIFTKSERVWRTNTRGDYWVLNIQTGLLKKLGGKEAKPSTLMFAQFSPDNNRVAYVRENNIYVEWLNEEKIVQLTHDGSRTIINGTFDWVYEEEFGLHDGFKWSPDGKKVAYWQLDASGVRDFLMINNTDSLYSYSIPVQYPKTGETNSACKVGVIDANGGSTTWMKLMGDPRQNYVARMSWAANSDEIMMQYLNRLQTNLQVLLGKASSGDIRVLIDQKDTVWYDVVETYKWTPDGKTLLWMSEEDGWRHIYLVDRATGKKTLVTNGKYDVIEILNIDIENGFVYFSASPENATQKYLYRVKIEKNGSAERITPSDFAGTNRYNISPDAKWAIHIFSNFGTPSTATLIKLPNHQKVRTLSENPVVVQKLAGLKKGPSDFFKVTLPDGTKLDGWQMLPPNFDASKKYPVLFYVYGEPGSQTVLDQWFGPQYLWHLMLTQKGYIVMSLDNRGTPAPRGKEWRKSIYRKIGVLNSADQAEGVKAAIKQYSYIDDTRVAIWGWSGGGSSTLNAMFRYPEVYKVGMAVAPVTDLRYYDSIYEERYMGLPAQNMDDYKSGSAINFADGLSGKLLLIHGTGDDNVHYQNSEALVNKLVELNKPFRFMSYPNRSHGIYEGNGTYIHLYNLLTSYLLENLPANK